MVFKCPKCDENVCLLDSPANPVGTLLCCAHCIEPVARKVAEGHIIRAAGWEMVGQHTSGVDAGGQHPAAVSGVEQSVAR